MNERSHARHVVDQFGTQAAAYVASAVHAAGTDLDRIGALVRGIPGARVLDLGCGGGHVAFAAAAAGATVTAYDLSEAMLSAVVAEAGRRGLDRIETRQGSAESLPFPGATFDAVLTRYSAHHWREVPRALTEARRVLKTDGLLVVCDIVSAEDPLLDTHLQAVELLRDPSHVRDYRVSEWRAMLDAAGFTPGALMASRPRMEFASWIARMRTPGPQVAAIRALQAAAPTEVMEYFHIEADGSFLLDSVLIESRPR
ncbi:MULTISPECIES: class I SAM-dependent methyltransferase [Methylobacterium]|uniref:Class I SAM-dependent methyltransferase n=1 Tax=Methylobacterium longum TaxID=767694 RepID=A0ABT8ASA7_9HYPH|nr:MULTISPECIES: class I SAM-dependent methyltransferase [Methylobacterium]MCJ2098840.1 class I SAM-dependent methyltransferase [Methylobacterium sp. E-046]MDN3572470.1 class I SAM-dependent methyltransferase [Methylobacterium longum]GJE09387.1 putative methyltransferase YcgJ [Methylobacterium longum]